MDNKQEFDEFAQNYRQILANDLNKLSNVSSDYFCEYKVETIFNELEKAPQKILDFGCGDGLSCEFFKKYFPDTEIFGVDISSESINCAKNKNINNSYFDTYNGTKLPFDNEMFDLIFAAGVFHHIESHEHQNILKEINRVLKNGGRIFIFEHNPLNPFTLKVVKDCAFDKDVKLISARNMKKMVKKSGFLNNEINFSLFFPRFKIFSKFFKYEKYFRKFPLGAQYYINATKN